MTYKDKASYDSTPLCRLTLLYSSCLEEALNDDPDVFEADINVYESWDTRTRVTHTYLARTCTFSPPYLFSFSFHFFPSLSVLLVRACSNVVLLLLRRISIWASHSTHTHAHALSLYFPLSLFLLLSCSLALFLSFSLSLSLALSRSLARARSLSLSFARVRTQKHYANVLEASIDVDES